MANYIEMIYFEVLFVPLLKHTYIANALFQKAQVYPQMVSVLAGKAWTPPRLS